MVATADHGTSHIVAGDVAVRTSGRDAREVDAELAGQSPHGGLGSRSAR